jgi:16S rRNA (guanine(966)-N(2))-methyltransferase RsmD
MRERAFSVLGDRVANSFFLDLFAGTGAVGLEALSRGATAAVFVEHHRGAARLIAENCAAFELDETRATVFVRQAGPAVADLARRARTFNVVWADPPFENWEAGLDALIRAFTSGLIATDGVGCLECPERAAVEAALPEGLEILRDLEGGASRVVLIRRTTGVGTLER